MRAPGIFAISDIETPSFGWTARIRWFGWTPSEPSCCSARCGTGRSVMTLSGAFGAGVVVVARAALPRDLLGRRDLVLLDEAAIPDRLEDAVREAEHQRVLDGLLAQVVIDAVDLPLLEDRLERAVQVQRRGEVVAERL